MIFYDVEVFRYDWLVVAANSNDKTIARVHNSREEMFDYFNEHMRELWVGYNNSRYDKYIIKAILNGENVKHVSDSIILEKIPLAQKRKLDTLYPFANYDTIKKTDLGLKWLEASMGSSIIETSVPFDIDRPLTDAEVIEAFDYCENDVNEMIKAFTRRKSDYNTAKFFVVNNKYQLQDMGLSKAQLASKMVGGNNRRPTRGEFDVDFLPGLDLGKYEDIKTWYKNPKNHDITLSYARDVAGVPHVFSWGGAHGAIKKFVIDGDFLLIDATAYYPSLIDVYGFGKCNMSDPAGFDYIHSSNIAFKRTGDKKAREPYKIMDNAIAGQMKQSGSALYNPQAFNNIVINGQLGIIDLVAHVVRENVRLIQTNTDGIILHLDNYDRDYDAIESEVALWEQRIKVTAEIDTIFGRVVQRDVNNYLIVDKETGSIKTKGALLKQRGDLDYDMAIIGEALREKFIHGTRIEDYINDCDDLRKFQKIIHAPRAFVGLLARVPDGDSILSFRTARVFQAKPNYDGITLLKARSDGSTLKPAGCPTNAVIINDSIRGDKCPEWIDKEWYINIAIKEYKAFTGTEYV